MFTELSLSQEMALELPCLRAFQPVNSKFPLAAMDVDKAGIEAESLTDSLASAASFLPQVEISRPLKRSLSEPVGAPSCGLIKINPEANTLVEVTN